MNSFRQPLWATAPAVRRGSTIIAVLVVLALLFLLAAMLLPSIECARETGYINTCRNNQSNVAKALFSYGNRCGGGLPGYINALDRTDKSLYIDPDTGKPTPVSWAVMILPDIDRQETFEQWQQTPANETGRDAKLNQTKNVNPSATTRLYVDLFVCPNDPARQKFGTPISFVVNTGLPDAALSATGPATKGAERKRVRSIPRDWRSNGMFFDNYTSDTRITTDTTRRPQNIAMRMELCSRPKDKTILLTENVDVGDYILNANRDSADDWRQAELMLGATWSADVVETDGKTLRKRPQPPALHLNERTGERNGTDMAFARPSSRHPNGINIAYVGQNVQFLRDTIDYYVYAKMMTSSDTFLMLPGTRTPIAGLGDVRLTDEQINP